MSMSLNFKIIGQGKPLVLLHGNNEDMNVFSGQVESFSKAFMLILVDTRGHGKSPRGDLPMTFQTFSDDLQRLLDKLGIEKPSILGFSDGGNTALTYAINHPRNVDRLVINGANLSPCGCKLSYQVPIYAEWLLMAILSLFSEQAKRRKEILSLMAFQPHIKASDLKKIRSRTLVIAGDCDMIKDKETRRIAQSIPESRLLILEGDHFLLKKRSLEYNNAVLDFLEQA